jgi:hypothetical protein
MVNAERGEKKDKRPHENTIMKKVIAGLKD